MLLEQQPGLADTGLMNIENPFELWDTKAEDLANPARHPDMYGGAAPILDITKAEAAALKNAGKE